MTLAFLIYAGVSPNVIIREKYTEEPLVQITDYHYQRKEVSSAPIHILNEYRFHVPNDQQRDTALSFYLFHQYATVSIDGECVYEIRPSGRMKMVSTTAYNWVTIPIYPSDAGKEVCVEITPVYKGDDGMTEFFMGPEHKFVMMQLKESWVKLMISELLIFVGVVLTGYGLYHLRKYPGKKEIFALGLTAIFMGLWRYTDSRFAPFMMSKVPVLLFLISYSCLMLGMFPLIHSQTRIVNAKIRNCYESAVVLLSFTAILMQWLNLAELRQFITLFHLLALIGFIIIIASAIYRLYRRQIRFDGEFIGLMLLGVGVLLDFRNFYWDRTNARSTYLQWAFLIYLVIFAFSNMMRASEQSQEILRKEQLIVNSRVTSMMGQIRSHFIFNILNAISGMCKYDPEKADETIICFARFLRTNINIMYNDAPVEFTTALKNLEDYIHLQNVRFGDKIALVEEIEVSDFTLPAIVMQPIVENSIKHGILPSGRNGVIRIHTYREADKIKIDITDDGVGFDPAILETKNESVGLKNIRLRLHYIADSSLDIASKPGEGTTVTITLDPAVMQEYQRSLRKEK